MKEINEVCTACGITANYLTRLKKYGKPPLKEQFEISTYHLGTCDVCGKNASVTEPRDFYNPDFNLILKKIK
jgi:rRNA maturation protein Nop10